MIKKITTLLKSDNKKALILTLLWLRESYSQCGEDIILDANIRRDTWFYVDIWANHPTKLNNFYLFYKKWWTGINIEPNYILYKKLLKTRKNDINLNIGIWNGEKLDFYIVDNHALSTFDKDTVDSYIKMGHKIIDTKKVETISLEKLFDRYAWEKTIDVLSVDVEWFDMAVLESNNWEKYKPTFILLETLEYRNDGTWKKTNHIYDAFLFQKWYEKLADTHINTIYQLKK